MTRDPQLRPVPRRRKVATRRWVGTGWAALQLAVVLGATLMIGRAQTETKIREHMRSAPADPPGSIVKQDRENHFQGQYMAYASPWSIFFDKELVHGKDYKDTITVQPDTFPDNTVIRTRWPVDRPMKSGVWGYHAIGFGMYDANTSPPIRIEPRRVKDIKRFVQTFDYEWFKSPNFNLLNEFYLTKKPGNTDEKIIEIGFLLHLPPGEGVWPHGLKHIGTYRDRARREWAINQINTFVIISPKDQKDVLKGKLDVREFLRELVRLKIITGDEWFNGIAFGMEPVKGAGETELWIKKWRVDYK
ncbi:MAG: hypothetical protein ABW184_10890 [Sphingobium sp.]